MVDHSSSSLWSLIWNCRTSLQPVAAALQITACTVQGWQLLDPDENKDPKMLVESLWNALVAVSTMQPPSGAAGLAESRVHIAAVDEL